MGAGPISRNSWNKGGQREMAVGVQQGKHEWEAIGMI